MHMLHQTFRRLLKSPGFSLLAILTLALGIGANSAIFSVVNAVLLEPLPYPEPHRLVFLDHAAPALNMEKMNISEGLYLFYREHAESFETIALVDDGTVTLTGLDKPQRLEAASVTPGTLRMLGVTPILGRSFVAEEERPGAPGVVLVSEGLWRTQLDARPEALGDTVEIDGIPREVVGVLPEGFSFPKEGVDLWIPYTLDPATAPLGGFSSAAVARLAEGVRIEQAHAELDHFLAQLSELFPDDEAAPILQQAGFQARLRSLRDETVGRVESSLWLLLGTVAFVLLIACANVANLILVRAEGRQRETAIRTALGASRGDHLRGGFTESFSLAACAALLALAVTHLGLLLLRRFGPQELPRLSEVAIDSRVLAFTLGVALITGLLFGLIPMIFAGVHNLATMLKDGSRSATSGRERHHLRRMLVAGQVALALVLLVGAGLMIRSYQKLSNVDPGFRVDETLTFRLSLPESKYQDDVTAARFWQTLRERLGGLPGVEAVAATTSMPLSGKNNGSGHELEDRPEDENSLPLVFRIENITEGYLETTGIHLLEGRALERADTEHRAGTVLVSQSLARTRWPGESALGKRLGPGSDLEEDPWYTVVGVVADVRALDLSVEPVETVYYPLLSKEKDGWVVSEMDVVVRYAGSREALMSSVRHAVWELDPDLPIANVRTLEQLVAKSQARQTFTVTLLLIAAIVALALGAVGTYGVISYLVAQRTSEIGIRLALGARTGQVAFMVLREGFLMAATGAAIGLLGALALTRWLENLLFQVSPLDPLTFTLVPALLLLSAFIACWVPAQRAARVDPIVALRYE